MPFADGPYVFSISSINSFAPKAPGVYGVNGGVDMIYVGCNEKPVRL